VKAIRFIVLLVLGLAAAARAEIQRPADAPQPLAPAESAKLVKLPPGFRLELVASEPLIREPSGVCWDERGRLFVCELHGYNLEGQYDIEELNKAGQLDREVRRIQANEQAREAAKVGTYGTVKLLRDTNGDGVMDQAEVFADHLPPAYGICAARGGIIVACAPDIVFLADRDGDGHAEVREKLFTGFATGALERGINQPQWGLDNWIYFGKGHGGGTITGPHLAKPVQLGNTDFRIKADGSAIESITGSTHTFGHAFTEDGERFISTTSVPGLFVTPLPWHYLARNPDAAAPRTEQAAGDYTRVFPLAAPHPWRSKRAQDPGFFKYYRDRYGAGDSDPGGWFTSACGPLVYQDVALPADCRGAYFVCEPAQNLIHRAVIERDGAGLRLRRAPGEEAKEFLASGDPWFHPIHLAHGPEGAIYIVDMYREIIEDYSAIPRYLQQQYGLTNGFSHGRLWRLTHDSAPRAPSADMSKLNTSNLAKETGSPHFWRRQTARRLLVERNEHRAAPALAQLVREARETSTVLNALYTLDALGDLKSDDASAALKHSDAAVRRHGLRFVERWLDTQPALLESVLSLANNQDAPLLLQTALTLGESTNARALPALAALARSHGNLKWMPNAVLSSLHNRGGLMVDELMNAPGRIGSAKALLEPLCAAIAARHDERELARAISRIAATEDAGLQTFCLRGLQIGLKNVRAVTLASDGRDAMNQLLASDDSDIRRLAIAITGSLATDPAMQKVLLAKATREIADVKLPAETRLAAVAQLSASGDASATSALLAAWPANTPKVRDAILDAVFSRRDRLPDLLESLERKIIPPAALTAFQRVTLLENDQPAIRERATRLLTKSSGASDDTFRRFAAALAGERDQTHGERVFRDNCATCHQTRGLGFAVGPDLGAEFQRAEEAILKDILAPNDVISAGFPTYVVETTAGQTFNGILASESATSVTLRMPAGLEQVILRKDIARFDSLPVSLMPEALAATLQPGEVADVIAWLRDVGDGTKAVAPGRVVLFDDEADFIAKLREGDGQASLETNRAFSGTMCLAVTPPQRFSARIPGWNFRIMERPVPGEFRYLRLAWRVQDAKGVMIELAANGSWPAAESPQRRYFSGRNLTKWEAREVSPDAPREWRVVTFDLWKDCGVFTLTGIAPTAMGGTVFFDRIELLRDLGDTATGQAEHSGIYK